MLGLVRAVLCSSKLLESPPSSYTHAPALLREKEEGGGGSQRCL
jgi:hypothetical protein